MGKESHNFKWMCIFCGRVDFFTFVAATGDHERDTSLGRLVDIRHQLPKDQR